MPDRNGYRDEYVNCADISIGHTPSSIGQGGIVQTQQTPAANVSGNASVADMSNSELLEALLVLADVNPVPDKITPLSNPISPGTQPEGNIAKHDELIQQLQSLGVLVPIDSPPHGSPSSVETLFQSPEAHTNPDYFLEQLQNLGVLVPVDPTATSTSTTMQKQMSSNPIQNPSAANLMQSMVPNMNQSPGTPNMLQSSQNQQQMIQPLQDIGVLVPVNQGLTTTDQSNQNVFKAQESKIKNNRQNELMKQLEGLGVIVPVGHVVQSPNNPALKDVPSPAIKIDPSNVSNPTNNNRPTNNFSSRSNNFQSNNFQSSRTTQSTRIQQRKSQLSDVFNTNSVYHNQATKSQQAQQNSTSFSTAQGGVALLPTRTQTLMDSSPSMVSSSSSSSSGSSTLSGANVVVEEPPGANSQFGNFGNSPNRVQQHIQSANNVNQQFQAQRVSGNRNENNSQNTRFQANLQSSSNFRQGGQVVNVFAPERQQNNLSPQRWSHQQNQQSLSQNFQNRNTEVGAFGLSGNNQGMLSPGGALLGDVVHGSEKTKNGHQTLSGFDQGLSSPTAGSLGMSTASGSEKNLTMDTNVGNQVIDAKTEVSPFSNKKFQSIFSTTTENTLGNTESKSLLIPSNVAQNKDAYTFSAIDNTGIIKPNAQSTSKLRNKNVKSIQNVNNENDLTNSHVDVTGNSIPTQGSSLQNNGFANIMPSLQKTEQASTQLRVPTENIILDSTALQKELGNTVIKYPSGASEPYNTLLENIQLIKGNADVSRNNVQSDQLVASEAPSAQQSTVKPVTPIINYEVTTAPGTTTTHATAKKTVTLEVPSLDMLMPIQLTTPPLSLQKLVVTTLPASMDYTMAPTTMVPPTSTYTVVPSFRQIPLESINNSPAIPVVDSSKQTSVPMASSLPNTTWGTKEKIVDPQGRESVWVSPNDPADQGLAVSNKTTSRVDKLVPSYDPNVLLQTTTETIVNDLPPLGVVNNENNNNNVVKPTRHNLDPFLYGIGAVPKFGPKHPFQEKKNVQVKKQTNIQSNMKTNKPQVSFKRNGLTIQKYVVQNQSKQRQASSSSLPLPNLNNLLGDSNTVRPATPSPPIQANLEQRQNSNRQESRPQIPENTARVEVVVRNRADSVKFFSTINNFPPAQRRRILELLRNNRITNLQFTNPDILTRLANMQVRRVPTPVRPTQAQVNHFIQRLSSTPNGRRMLQQWRQRMMRGFIQPQRAETVAPPTIVQATAVPRRENVSQSANTDSNATVQNSPPTLATFLQQETPAANVRQQFNSAVNLVRQLQREQQAEEVLQQHLQDYTRNGQFSLARTVLNTLQLLQERKSGLMQQIQELRREIHESGNTLQAEITEAPLQRSALQPVNRVTRAPNRPPPSARQAIQRQQPSSSSSSSFSSSSQQNTPNQQQIQSQVPNRQQVQMLNNQLQQFFANMQRAGPQNRPQTPAGSLSTQPAQPNNRESRLRSLLMNARRNPFGGINRSQNRPAFPANNVQMFG